jgi:hypothetical protein
MKVPQITVDQVKVAKFASEETLCFQARVLFEGVPFARARNDGHGGCTFLDAINGRSSELYQKAEKLVKALPPIKTEFKNDDGSTFEYKETLDGYVDSLVSKAQEDKDVLANFKRSMKSKVMFIRDGKLMEYRGVKDPAQRARIIANHSAKAPADTIFDSLPTAAAIALFRAHVYK